MRALLGTISGLWLVPSSLFGGPGLLGICYASARFLLVWIIGSSANATQVQSLRDALASGPLYILQAQVGLCLLWEMQSRAPVLSAAPYAFASAGGAMLFLEVALGAPLMRLALRLVDEERADRIGRACVLGAEGAPPVITLKLIDWEVRAGSMGSHVSDLKWNVRDIETTAVVDEASVRRILLNSKPTAFISMMQEDKLNYVRIRPKA